MRTLGHIDDPYMKVTILEMNHRISVKFEFDLMEQTYKLSEEFKGNPIEIIKERLTVEARQRLMDRFRDMKTNRMDLSETIDTQNQDFPEII